MSPFHHLYYRLKPLLPFALRLRLRRALAKRQLRTVGDIWPIDEQAGRTPEGWPGWPDGKQFALVLTHDVEGPRGLERCQQLAELEMSLGFRSSFNFIPEGPYTVPSALRSWLTEQRFEVGVHDLHHDGKLYRSRTAFRRHAQKINRYLENWGAVGFRSGSMHHKLDWIHDLNIAYDTSTFDTDPFEPQPDGVRTIFPFWVERPEAGKPVVSGQRLVAGGPRSDTSCVASGTVPSGSLVASHSPLAVSETATRRSPLVTSGYLELPYTLPQDSTLFLVLRERTIDIWKRKLDWIAGHCGMALVNVHPDYVAFGTETASANEFPSGLYRELLEYARTRYPAAYCQPAPHEVARFCAALRPRRPVVCRPRRVCMICYSFYQSDTRVMRYAESLVERGDRVDVLGLRQTKGLQNEDTIRGVHVRRIQPRHAGEKNKWLYLLRVSEFLLRSSLCLCWRHLRKEYDVVHVHNMPDFLVFTAWLPKLTGAKIILDIHDLVPDFYVSKYGAKPDGLAVGVLKRIERASAWFADRVIISNHLWHDKLVARSVPLGKCAVFVNQIDPKMFYHRRRPPQNGHLKVLFPGGLYRHQGLDLAIKAFGSLDRLIPEAELHIYGDGDAKNDLVRLTNQLGLQNKVRFYEPVPARQVPELIAEATVGVVPKRADLFGNEAYSTKIVEFMSQGVPVVVARTKIDTYYFTHREVCFFEPENVEDLTRALERVMRDKDYRESLIQHGLDYAARNNWGHKKQDYLDLVDRLCG